MDSLEYIDGYFSGEFPPEETGQFEKRIQEDPLFADEVAYYLSSRIALKEEYARERKKRFREIYEKEVSRPKVRSMVRGRWSVVLAAAALILAIVLCWSLFFSSVSGPKLADRYIRENLDMLSVKMGTGDSMQTGLRLYNERKFPEALAQFESILRVDSFNSTALLDAGIAALRIQDYDKALSYFRKLEVRTDPHINPAFFYEALTLMKRDHPEDVPHAKQLLQKIVKEDLDKRADAERLLKEI